MSHPAPPSPAPSRALPAAHGPRPRPAVLRAAVLAVVTAGTAVLLAGCADTGTPQSAGRTPAVSGPVRLWPDRPPAPPPSPAPGGDNTPMPLPALPRVPAGDIHKVPVLSVVRAQRDLDARRGAPAFDKGTENRIRACNDTREPCPVRAAEYHDLTGDGKDELIAGVEGTGHTLAIWVYTVRNGVVHRILDAAGTPKSVEVADDKLIMREPTETPGYEIRSVYAWDGQVMVLQSTEYDWHSPSPAASPGRMP
ncbi:hypothetical protein [Streptomyces orinoci]|uniref:Lipoprotein n=1 Tax=Streptomyces orinoci TaxID=67339 RepID=A0ABV3K5X7_STRON|nr:hypothetical protein [Streptomyces orinoci]